MIKLRMKKATIFFSSVLIFMLHLPFAFSTSKPLTFEVVVKSKPLATTDKIASMAMIYNDLELNSMGLSQNAFDNAIKGYEYLLMNGKISNEEVISIVDFTKSSAQKRLFVIDIKNAKVLFNTYVSHGQHTGQEFAKKFSNNLESNQSSLGFYITSGTYMGKNGFSMRLNGLENNFNDRAVERAIVMHGASYVSEGYIKSRGFLGRSLGCPAVPEKLNKPIIEKIKNGSCLFIYSEDNRYLSKSKILNS